MKALFSLALMVLFVSGCAHWTEKRCQETNFNQKGFAEGSQGMDSQINRYNQACLKKEVKIDMNAYNAGYQKGLRTFCTPQSGSDLGIRGEKPHRNCQMIDKYMHAYEASLKKYCSVERGTQDGYAMHEKNSLCTPYSSYNIGYKNGVKNYCSYEKGQEDGFSDTPRNQKCSGYRSYMQGFSQGQKNFCSPENGKRLGEKGISFPDKCFKKSGRTFEKAYNSGRKLYLAKSIKELEVNMGFERRNYETLRDELQDAQFTYQNMPKYPKNPDVADDKEELRDRIESLRARRDDKRADLSDIERELNKLKSEQARL